MGIKKMVAKAVVKMDRMHRAVTRPVARRLYGETWEKMEEEWDDVLVRALRGEDVKEQSEELMVQLAELGWHIGDSLQLSKGVIQWETPAQRGHQLRVLKLWPPTFRVGFVEEAPEGDTECDY